MKKFIFIFTLLFYSCHSTTVEKSKGKTLDKKSVENVAIAKKNITKSNSPYCFATEVILDEDEIILLNAQFYWQAEDQGNHLQFLKSLKEKNARRKYEIAPTLWVFEAYHRLQLDTLQAHTLLLQDTESENGYISLQIKSDSIDNLFFIDRRAYHLSQGVNPTLLEFAKAVLQNKPYLVE